jgi:hypothetical protein
MSVDVPARAGDEGRRTAVDAGERRIGGLTVNRRLPGLLIAAAMVVSGGCATAEEWTVWKDHPTHFASGQHLVFSARNVEGLSPAVSRSDIVLARDQGWWGKSVTVSQEQILER